MEVTSELGESTESGRTGADDLTAAGAAVVRDRMDRRGGPGYPAGDPRFHDINGESGGPSNPGASLPRRSHRRRWPLLAENLPAQGLVKEFYLRLTGIVRQYVEDTTGIRAPEQTTEEFLRDMRRVRYFRRSAPPACGISGSGRSGQIRRPAARRTSLTKPSCEPTSS